MQIVRKLLGATILAVLFVLPFSASVPVVHAQSDVESGYTRIMADGLIFGNICSAGDKTPTIDKCECRATGNCSLSDMMQIFVNISIGILAICGSVALLVFVYGGWLWITSAGNEKNVSQGKDAITKAVIGLAIIFGSYAIVNFIIAGLAGQAPSATIEDTIDNVIQDSDGPSASTIINTQ